jgi:hypothetical protein
MSEIRYDSVKLPKMSLNAEGFLKGKAPVSRTGVLKYTKFDGSYTLELRHPEHVFNADSLESLKMRPISEEHAGGLISVDNIKETQKGYIGETVEQQGNLLVSSMVITDKSLINKIKTGIKNQLSAGYTCDVIKEDGVYNGEKYTHIQTNIRYNHVTVTGAGRAGAEVAIRTDSVNNNVAYNLNEETMENQELQTKLDSITLQKAVIEKENENLKLLIAQANTKHDSISQAYDKIKVELEHEKKIRSDSMVAETVKKTLKALVYGAKVLGNPAVYVNHTAREIMITAINAQRKLARQDSVDFSRKSDDAVDAYFTASFNTNDTLKTDGLQICQNLDSIVNNNQTKSANDYSVAMYKELSLNKQK